MSLGAAPRLWAIANVFFSLLVSVDGLALNRSTTSRHQVARTFIRKVYFTHTLRICNAYPYISALDVYLSNENILLTTAPLQYRECGEFTPVLRAADKIDFKAGEANAGTFTISDLPNADSVLVLVIHRHDTMSTAVAFMSHVFTTTTVPQIAVLDAYKGTAASEVHIEDVTMNAGHSHAAATDDVLYARDETLRYNSVVAVDPGSYQVMLKEAPKNTSLVTRELVAKSQESYIVIRCGVEATDGGPSYPEELLVFPDPTKVKQGGAVSSQFGGALFLTLAATMITSVGGSEL